MSNPDSDTTRNNIAVVGMSARLPGAPDIDAFWRNLRDGVESIQFLPDPPPAARGGLKLVPAVSSLDGIKFFDAAFFGFTPREAETMDPQVRVFLECAWAALEHSGYDAARFHGSIGVYAGSATSTYLFANLMSNPEAMGSGGGVMSSLGLFNDRDCLSTLVSYKLDLTGPSVTVQTFCSTSMVAVHLACQSLLNGETDMALAGGVSIIVGTEHGYPYQEGGILSPDGHCRTFDERAQGTVFGNGAGIVVLRRLADALRDGDTVHAVVKGTAINNDGAQKGGYSAPSVIRQSNVIAEAMAIAKVHPESISYVEAHGTATKLGDPIEVEALTRAFRGGTVRTGFCAIGSVKSNFGHLDRAAGVTAVIKTVLALKHRQIPPSLHYHKPNPNIEFEHTPFFVNTGLSAWHSNGAPRRAGVNALGVGGTNAHTILEEAPPVQPLGPSRSAQLLLLSAKTQPALDRATQNLLDHLKANPQDDLADVAYTLQVGRQKMTCSRIVVCETLAEAIASLEELDSQRIRTSVDNAVNRPVVFMFSGQGAQYPNMTSGLYQTEPTFRECVDTCCRHLHSHNDFDLKGALFCAPNQAEAAAQRLNRTAAAQPALFVVEYALATMLMSWGIRPEAMIGHSIGEYVAACLAGVFSLEDALALVAARGQMMQQLPPGAMLAVPLPADKVRPLLGDCVALAAVNAPSLCVVSGPADAVASIEDRLTTRQITCRRLHTSHAFHSSMMDPILGPFAKLVGGVRSQPPRIPYISNLTGDWITPQQATDPAYWAAHLRQTVRFSDGVRKLWSEPDRILLEVGPGKTLQTLAKQHSLAAKGVVLSTVRHADEPQGDVRLLLNTLGRLWSAGAHVNWAGFYSHERRRRIALPTYPFERTAYWIERTTAAVPTVQSKLERNPDPAAWLYVPGWKSSMPLQPRDPADSTQPSQSWLMLVANDAFSAQLVERLKSKGHNIIVVTAGDGFRGSVEAGFQINPDSPQDFERLLQAIRERGRDIGRIVHGWTLSSRDDMDLTPKTFAQAQRDGFYSLLFLAKALGTQGWRHPLSLKILSSGMHAVFPADIIHPEKSTALALAKVIPQEYHNVLCSAIDIDLSNTRMPEDHSALDQLALELATDAPGTVMAHRMGRRWEQTYDAVRSEGPVGVPGRLRSHGTYLITGGLGNVAFALADYLAKSVQARLILIGRTSLPPRDQWVERLATHAVDDAVNIKIRMVHALEDHGAEVLTAAADVGDADQIRAVVVAARRRFGTIHGVIHAAGVLGAGVFGSIEEIDIANCRQQFHAKATGLLVLEEVLEGQDLDFCLLTSSLSSVLGGFHYGAYPAANAFMDAFTHRHNQKRAVPWISVNWDEWRLASNMDFDAGGGGIAQLGMTAAEGAEAFARILGLQGVPQVVVSTGDLAARIDRWIRLEAGGAATGVKQAAPANYPRPNLASAYVAPGDATQQKVAAIWQELLGIDRVGIHDNFFELGGHSLLAIQVISRINAEFEAGISVATLFEGPTVHSLGKLITAEEGQLPTMKHSSDRGRRRKERSRQRFAGRSEERP